MQVDLSQLLTIGGSGAATALTLWAHGRDFRKERKKAIDEYLKAEIAAEGIRRDIRHLQNDFKQMSSNILHFDEENEDRFRALESKQGQLSGSLEVLISLNRTAHRAGD